MASLNRIKEGRDVFASAEKGAAHTPSDTVNASFEFKALWVGTGGNIAVVHQDGDDPVVYANVPVGFFQVRGIRVNASSTTASDLVGVSW